MAVILEMDNVTKSYNKTKVIDQFSLKVEKGHIYGLIGPNGAGKTTIMRMLAGLSYQDSGQIKLFGQSDNLDIQRSRMSFMLEAPYIDGTMTARQNMSYIRYLRGVASEERIDEILEFIGLANTGKKQTRNYSLGMRQRLGIGMALLSGPEIMVLDEPINGLDPEGIVEVRKMLLKLCKEQETTILLSSHLLSELYELCTDFTIINHGKLIESISRKKLEEKSRKHLVIKTNALDKTVAMLEDKLHIKNYKIIQQELHLYDKVEDLEQFVRLIFDHNFIVTKLVYMEENLEDYYLEKVGGMNGQIVKGRMVSG